jgi:hypothetical protein
VNATFRRIDSLVRQPLLPRWRIRTGGQAAAILAAACVSSLYSIGVAIASASLLFAGPLSDGLAPGAGALA